ncbi:PEP-CTERM sorting domain-containing protein [Geomonas sp. Red32]|uniref:PEP-CTERM sorting domain-containing protein n=1 Tax=Geomonas sp. Red32 TaxID=2912856 RepID=UPI00202CE340|nr:PEP-CTERM sorting domain-containing protein [Geomonas sp. Red32]MCM0083351.1 PEP-CTERM sorting domain-containing protein [Geomonas sp. Red32]
MKKLLTLICAAIFIAAMAPAAMATPVYSGDTYANFGVGNNPTASEAGYYLWSNDPDRRSWSLRWTGGSTGNENFFGTLRLSLPASSNTVDFETYTFFGMPAGDVAYSMPFNGSDYITFKAVEGTGWDGIDFTVGGVPGDLISLSLGGDLFSGTAGDTATASKIYVGQDLSNPVVVVGNYLPPCGTLTPVLNFDVPAPVPEPGSLVLLGAGFLGVAIYCKRRKNA